MIKGQTEVLRIVTDFYLNSGDFNGCPINYIKENIDLDKSNLTDALERLIKSERMGLVTSREEMIPHIIRTGFTSIANQTERLKSMDDYHTQCFYPLKKHLDTVIDKSYYRDQPYKLELALGAPQLSYKSFDLSVLEMYRNDPRYYYDTNDIGGKIGVSDEHYESTKMNQSDKVLLQSFGYSIDENHNRAVGVFVCDLAGLSNEHQRMWKAKELGDSFTMHPGYYKSQVYGSWAEGVSVFDALLKEIYVINQLCKLIEYLKLFRNDFGEYGEEKPKLLTFLIRPTLKEFNDFISVLDKILSDNLNNQFFKKDLDLETETEREDGKIIISHKGTIQLLDEWMRKKYKFRDDTGWKKSIDALKKVRRLRQNPAHKLEIDTFDYKYISDQRELAIEVYYSINFLRMLLQRHPKVKDGDVKIPDWLEEGKIYAY